MEVAMQGLMLNDSDGSVMSLCSWAHMKNLYMRM